MELSNYGSHRSIAQRSAFLFHSSSIQFDKGDAVARSTIRARGINVFFYILSDTVTRGKQVTSRVGNALPRSCCNLTGNVIFLRSHRMAFRTPLAKGHRLLRNKSTQDLPGDLQNTATVSLSSTTTTPQKKFKKTNDTRHDISVLAISYILKDNPIIQELICLIIGLRDQRDDNVCKTCNHIDRPLSQPEGSSLRF